MNTPLAHRLACVTVALVVLLAAGCGSTPVSIAQKTPASPSGAQPASTVSPNSIAVLAFANLSEDKSNEYFADGMAEEIINQLGKMRELRVAGRSASFAFKGTQTSLKQIGEKLQVASCWRAACVARATELE
jgi:TolB-like protein